MAAVLAPAAVVSAQERPRSGGELVFVVPAAPPSFDGHREETFAMLHPVAPHYNTLLRTDPTDKTVIFPPAGIVSSRQAQYKVVESVEAPSADTIVFRLKWPEASFTASLASPWNWIYKAEILAKDPR